MNIGNDIPVNPAKFPAPDGISQGGSITGPIDIAASKINTAPYIIRSTSGKENLQELLSAHGVVVESTLESINGVLATLDDETRKKIEAQGFDVIPDVEEQMLPPLPWRKAQQLEEEGEHDKAVRAEKIYEPRKPLTEPRWNTPLARKYTGKGIGIAVVDSGLYPHPDFIYPTNRIAAFVDIVNGRTIPYDDNGHGTHVAGDAAGNGHLSNGLHRGPAPEASLIGVKVLAGSGQGRTSDVVKGIQWVIENKEKYGIRIMNLSLGHPSRKDRSKDPVDLAVEKAYRAGIVVVAAAGNEGPHSSTIGAPGDSPYAITVGAADDKNTPSDPTDDKITDFSSRGPTKNGETKPDLVAPGEGIVAPNAPGTEHEIIGRRFKMMRDSFQWLLSLSDEELRKIPQATLTVMGLKGPTILKVQEKPAEARKDIERMLSRTERVPMTKGGEYIGLPGTSMASPIVAGVVAQLLEANPDLTVKEIKEILTETAEPLPRYGKNTQGAGMVNPEVALEMALALRDDPGSAA